MIFDGFRELGRSLMQRTIGIADLDRMMDFAISGYPTSSGFQVTSRNALSLPPVWACVDLLGKAGSVLPGNVFRHLPAGGVQDRAKDPGHYLQPLIHDYVNPSLSAMEWRRLAICHYLLWGNHYSWIEWGNHNRPVAMYPLSPEQVRCKRDSLQSPIQYFIRDQKTGQETEFKDWEILHFRGMSLDGCTGLSPIGQMREAFGLVGATQQSAAAFHKHGFSQRLVLTYPGALDDEQMEKLRASFQESNAGLQNAHKALVLQNGITVAPFSINPKDAEFVLLAKFTDSKIYQIYGIPPHMVGDTERSTSWGTGMEQQTIVMIMFTLLPIINLLETTLEHVLLPPGTDRFIEYELKGLMRGDTAARGAWHKVMVELGVYSPNDVLRYENEEPYVGGEVYRRALNTAFVDRNGKVTLTTMPGGAAGVGTEAVGSDVTPPPDQQTQGAQDGQAL